MSNYLTVQSNGFITYCDALIARLAHNRAESFLFSLVGSPAQVQAASAHFFNGGFCRVADGQNADFELSRCYGTVHSIRAKKIGDIVTKVLISADHFPGAIDNSAASVKEAVVFGPDIGTAKARAFMRLNTCTTMPLKPEWGEWLWDEVLNPERLFSFGNRQLLEAWAISWDEEGLENQILEGVRQNYLT